MIAPKRPTGTNAEAQFMRWVYDSILSLRVQPVPGATVSRTTRGTFVAPQVSAASRPGLKWRGEFDISKDYAVNDLVRESDQLADTDPDYVAGNTYPGIWLCIKATKATGEPARCDRPVYPEPADPNWILIALAVGTFTYKDAADCTLKQVRVNMGEPQDAP